MSEHRCSCGQSHQAEFDAQKAFENLSHKFRKLSQMVSLYMSEANLDRPTRAVHAATMAAQLERIVGGLPTTGHPECCLIGHRAGTNTFTWFCTGVLIHPRIVLTAGHCNVPQFNQPTGPSINVVALKVTSQNDLSQAQIVGVRRRATHPGFISTRLLNDITVLILRNDALVEPAPVATTAEIVAAAETTLVGFGNTDFNSTIGFGLKREVSVPITFIRKTPAEDFTADENRLGFESDIEFVAGGGGRDSCNGDSGGPAYIVVNGVKKLAGLTSRATDDARHACGDAGIYTRVDSNLAFVRQTALENGIEFP